MKVCFTADLRSSLCAGMNVTLKLPKSSGRQLDHRGTVQCTIPGQPGFELKGKFTDRITAVPAGAAGSPPAEREVFRSAPAFRSEER